MNIKIILGLFLVSMVIMLFYYGAMIALFATALDSVDEKSKECGGIVKCAGKSVGGVIKDFQEGMEQGGEK